MVRRRKEGEEKETPEGTEEPEITIDTCEDGLNEYHTLLSNVLERFNESFTSFEAEAIGYGGIICVELVLSDEDMMAQYQNRMITIREEAKEKKAKEKGQ